MYCMKCGARLEEGSKFCVNCGSRIEYARGGAGEAGYDSGTGAEGLRAGVSGTPGHAGQNPSGQSQPGRIPSGQNPAGQNPSRQNPSGQSLSGKNQLRYIPSGQNPAGQNLSQQTPLGRNPSQQNSSGQAQAGRNLPGRNPSGWNMSGQNPSGQSHTRQDPTSQNQPGRIPSSHNLSGRNPSRQSLSGKNQSGHIPSGQNPVGQNPSRRIPSAQDPLRQGHVSGGSTGTASEGPQKQKKHILPVILIILAAALAVIAVIIIYVVFSGSSGKETASGAGTKEAVMPIQDLWREQYDLGQRYLAELDYEQAVVAFTRAIEIDPNRTEAYIARAEAYLEGDAAAAPEENLRLALEDYETVLELDGTQTELYLEEAEIYTVLEDFESAVTAYTRAIEGGQRKADVYVRTARLYISMEDYDRAEEILKEGTKANPDSSEISDLGEEVNFAHNMKRYSKILDELYYNIKSGWNSYADVTYMDDIDDNDDLSYTWWMYAADSGLDGAGYAFIYPDDSDIPALLVTADVDDGSIYDVYTWADGETEHVIEAGERNIYYLCSDKKTILLESYGGHNHYQYYYYRLSGNGLVIHEGVCYDGTEDPDEPWFYQSGEDRELVHITESEAYAVIDSYEKAAYELTLFADYTPSGERDDAGREETTADKAGKQADAQDDTAQNDEMIRLEIEDKYLSKLISTGALLAEDPGSAGYSDLVGDSFRELTADLTTCQLWEQGNGMVLGVYPRGYLYYGEMADGVRSGHGTWILSESDDISGLEDDIMKSVNTVFSGEWSGDYPNGAGSLYIFDRGNEGGTQEVTILMCYEMNFVNGRGDGEGTFTVSSENSSRPVGSASVRADNGLWVAATDRKITLPEDNMSAIMGHTDVEYAKIGYMGYVGYSIYVNGAYLKEESGL